LREDAPEQIRTAREAIAKGDAEALQRVGHALRGALANLAAPTAATIAGELESKGNAGDVSSAEATLSTFENELTRVIASLEALCMETVQ
jgi:HPt (histidine-containing phosphotransfer) domain-containing protein